jgi:hypothetical protein
LLIVATPKEAQAILGWMRAVADAEDREGPSRSMARIPVQSRSTGH